ncbi:MAG: dipeptidase [Candidatus Promineifilaceae bacterium]
MTSFVQNNFIWDAHCGFEMTPNAPLAPLLQPWRDGKIDHFSINVYYDPHPWTRCIENIAALRRRIPIEVPWCRVVSSLAEIDAAYAEGKAAVTFDIEGMNALNGRVDLVQTYYELGVRQMLFAYNKNNAAGGGCHDEDRGLTDFGRKVIDEMNRVGMLIDCSHTGYKTSMDAMARSTAPVVFSHSNALALADHGRNIRDDQIKACAATGGVIGINGLSLFLGDKGDAQPATVARHVAYMAELVGVQHVGITLDYDPDVYDYSDPDLLDVDNPEYWPIEAGYDKPIHALSVTKLPAVCKELQKLGFTQNDLIAILSGNFRRIAKQVWK